MHVNKNKNVYHAMCYLLYVKHGPQAVYLTQLQSSTINIQSGDLLNKQINKS